MATTQTSYGSPAAATSTLVNWHDGNRSTSPIRDTQQKQIITEKLEAATFELFGMLGDATLNGIREMKELQKLFGNQKLSDIQNIFNKMAQTEALYTDSLKALQQSSLENDRLKSDLEQAHFRIAELESTAGQTVQFPSKLTHREDIHFYTKLLQDVTSIHDKLEAIVADLSSIKGTIITAETAALKNKAALIDACINKLNASEESFITCQAFEKLLILEVKLASKPSPISKEFLDNQLTQTGITPEQDSAWKAARQAKIEECQDLFDNFKRRFNSGLNAIHENWEALEKTYKQFHLDKFNNALKSNPKAEIEDPRLWALGWMGKYKTTINEKRIFLPLGGLEFKVYTNAKEARYVKWTFQQKLTLSDYLANQNPIPVLIEPSVTEVNTPSDPKALINSITINKMDRDIIESYIEGMPAPVATLPVGFEPSSNNGSRNSSRSGSLVLGQ